jgi:hypothetical protein
MKKNKLICENTLYDKDDNWKSCKRVAKYKCSACGFVLCKKCANNEYYECPQCCPEMVKI